MSEKQAITTKDVGKIDPSMLAPEKHPQLRQLRVKLQAEKDAILKKVAPAREAYERLINDPKLVEARKVIKENNKRLGEIDNQLAGIAVALGGRRMGAEPGQHTSRE